MSDSLLRRVAAGEKSAVEQCIDRFGGLVWSLARRFSQNTSDAEDAVQEVFIDLWRCASRFDEGVASEVTFVAMIARRRLIDRHRHRRRTPETTGLPPDVSAAPSDELDRVEICEEASQAAQAMQALRPEQQQVLRLSIYNGLSHDEISRTTGLPLGTVKTHARRGLIRIRELLSSAGDLKGGAS